MTRSRSLVHMLNVFAERLETDHGPKEGVKAIRLLARDRTIRRAEHRDCNRRERERVAAQRKAFHEARSGAAIRDLMLQRAYDLLWDGDSLGCDALLEFVPEADATAMLNAWSNDQDGKEPRSKWYEARSTEKTK